ncbi:fibronectin type III domain-containing protein [Paenibacillus chartarius]|uniref:Fibronectin type III domain-containing protein n=1 Tax=Paenibacillus chartarius TaxID=747481 RepID=A0ABV6DUG7_9BACL
MLCSFLLSAQALSLGGVVHAAEAGSTGELPAANAGSSVTEATYSIDTIAPTASTKLAATAVTASSVSLSWDASTDNVGITGYEIYNGTTPIASLSGTTYTVENLNPATTYTFTVKAKDAAGNVSPASNQVQVTTTALAKTLALAANEYLYETESLSQTNSGDSHGWVADTAASGGNWSIYNSNAANDYVEYQLNVPETGNYLVKVKYKYGYNRSINQLSVNGTPLGAPIDNYDPIAKYIERDLGVVNLSSLSNKLRFTVTGKNAASTGYLITLDSIKLVKQTAADTTAPTAPANLTAPSKTDTTVNLSWTASTDNVGVAGYDVYNGTSLVGTATGTTFAVTGLTANTAYTFTVKAKDAAGNASAASNAVTVTTNPASTGTLLFEAESLPQADSGDTTSAVSDASASNGQWENFNANAVGDYIEYALNVNKPGTYEVLVKTKTGPANGTAQLSIDGVSQGTPIDFYKAAAGFEEISRGMISFPSSGFKIVRFAVTGKNSASTGYAIPLDAIRLVGKTDTEAPTAPTNVIVTGKTGSTISLSWSPSTDNVGVTNYEIYNGATRIAITPAAAGTNYTVSGLKPNTAYTFSVKAVDGSGNVSAASSSVTAVTSSQLALTPLPITLGYNHSLYVKADGTLWAWGYNGYGELGNGTTNHLYQPNQTINIDNVKAAAGGRYHSIAVKDDGTVYAWGYNGYGQLGDGSTTTRHSPIKAANLTGIVSVAAGENHSLALKSDGTVWAFGLNGDGQLGDGTNTTQKSPVAVSGLTNVKAIASGKNFSLALKNDGTVWAWGSNTYGELGNGQTSKSNVPVQVSVLTNVAAIAAGEQHGLALKNDGTVWAWGYNSNGELGNSSTINQVVPVQIKDFGSVKSIAAGADHSLAVKTDGSVYAWGYNGYGQLGLGHTSNRTYPERIPTLSSIQSVTAGSNQTIALGNDGILYSFGNNNYGQLGNGTNHTYYLPQKVIGPNINPADTTAPATVTDFRLTSQNARQIKLDWTKTTDDVGVSSYEIYNGKVLLGTTEPSSSTFTINNLALNTTYYFTAKAKDATGNSSAASAIVTATTSDKTPPTTPKDLVLLGVSNSTITLSWTGSTDNDVVKQYNIYDGTTKLGSTASTSLTLTGLTSKKAYSLTIKAQDDSGNESTASAVLAVTTE